MPIKISALPTAAALGGSESFEAVQGGSSVKVSGTQIKTYAGLKNISFRTVTNGFSETFGGTDDVVILNAGGTLATGTVTMPGTPLNGQVASLSSAMEVTALLVSPNIGQFIVGAPSTITAILPVAFVYNSANSTWYRVV